MGSPRRRPIAGPALVLSAHQRGVALRTAVLSDAGYRRRDGEDHKQERQAHRSRLARWTTSGGRLLLREQAARPLSAAQPRWRGDVAADGLAERRMVVVPVDRARARDDS